MEDYRQVAGGHVNFRQDTRGSVLDIFTGATPHCAYVQEVKVASEFNEKCTVQLLRNHSVSVLRFATIDDRVWFTTKLRMLQARHALDQGERRRQDAEIERLEKMKQRELEKKLEFEREKQRREMEMDQERRRERERRAHEMEQGRYAGANPTSRLTRADPQVGGAAGRLAGGDAEARASRVHTGTHNRPKRPDVYTGATGVARPLRSNSSGRRTGTGPYGTGAPAPGVRPIGTENMSRPVSGVVPLPTTASSSSRPSSSYHTSNPVSTSAPPAPSGSSSGGTHQFPSSLEAEEEMIRRAMELSKADSGSNLTQRPPARPAPSAAPAPKTTSKPTEEELDQFRLLEELGEGAQGSIFRGETMDGRKQFVLKKVKCKSKEEMDRTHIWALQFKMNIQHDNIVEYIKVDTEPGSNNVTIAMPLYQEQDLEKYIATAPGKIDQNVILSFTRQIASALSYLHDLQLNSKPLVHRDLKPANVLLAENKKKCVLIDFDSWGKAGKADCEGTMEFTAPETIKKGEATGVSDVWSLGAILFLLLALPPFPMLYCPSSKENLLLNAEEWGTDPEMLAERIRHDIPRSYDKMLVELCVSLLCPDPVRRPGAKEALKRVDDIRARLERDRTYSGYEAISVPAQYR
eukprot:TRINITY_DN3536_c0_g1_i1.p1 TRINITY_DN3536_c0_g1~~TRINITY_DN3536_c0_g1_i1.p1  ORF type:complete len:634 (+),score=102.70 TRINITY_DN3536_c0_g1_i1:57-1958(+)